MSNLTKQLMDNAREKGAVREQSGFFSVTDKKMVDAGGGQMIEVRVPNGQHRLKIVSEKIGAGKAFDGSDEQQLQMVVNDNGVERQWNVGIKNKQTGKVNYIIEALEGIELGEEFLAEAFKMKTGKFGTKISKVGASVPTIQLDDDASEEDMPSISGEKNISPEDIPF